MRKKISDCKNLFEKVENYPFVYHVRAILKINRENQVSAFAAQAAFFLLLSLFPFLMIIVYGVRLFFDTEEELMEIASGVFPDSMIEELTFIVEEIYASPMGITMIISIIVAVWSASRGTMAIEQGLNFMDKSEKKTRNYIVRRLINSVYTIIFCVMMVALIGVYVLGNTIIDFILANVNDIWLEVIEDSYVFIRLLTGPVLIFSIILLIYCRLPDNRMKLKNVIPGAVFTTVCIVFLSVAFSAYIENFGFNTYMYGNFGGMVIAMLWIYVSMYVFMIGAEINLFFRDEVAKVWDRFKKKIKKGKRQGRKENE